MSLSTNRINYNSVNGKLKTNLFVFLMDIDKPHIYPCSISILIVQRTTINIVLHKYFEITQNRVCHLLQRLADLHTNTLK